MLVGVLQQIAEEMRDVQSLFKSSRRRRKVLRVEPVLDKIHQIYKGLLEQRGIRYQKVKVGGSPLTANTTDGVIMQVLINLFDNASYWLDTVEPSKREIRVTVDGEQGELIFRTADPASTRKICRIYSSRFTPGRDRRDEAWVCTLPASYWSGMTTALRPQRITREFWRAPTSSSAL